MMVKTSAVAIESLPERKLRVQQAARPVPASKTWAVVLADYCLLARCLSLLPWNRVSPPTRAEVVSTFLTPPAAGSVMQGSVRSRA